MRDTLLTVHILAAGAWFGANVVRLLVLPGFAAKGSAVAAHAHRSVSTMARTIYMPASLLILVTGILLLTAVDDSPYEFSDPFVSIGFLAVIVAAGLGMGVFAPRSRRAAAAHERGESGRAAALERQILSLTALDTAVAVVAVAAMVGKWGV